MKNKLLLFLSSFFIVMGIANVASSDTIKTDFVFMIDATSSMSGEIAGVKNGFAALVNEINDINLNDPDLTIDARFAVVVFGGAAELTLDFTSDLGIAQTALNNITIGGNATQNNHNYNPEAGLEAIRQVLGAGTELVNNHIPTDGFLDFRADARINLILATDENSDTPYNDANRFPGQTGSEGPNGDWQAEVDATAQAVIQNQAYINMLINRNDSPSTSQYGDYLYTVLDGNGNYDAAGTLANLLADSATQDSLQAQVLAAGTNLIARSFNVANANDPVWVGQFLEAKLYETIHYPKIPTVPEPTTMILLGFGLIGMAGISRRK